MTLTLTLREEPNVPLEAQVLTPDRLAGTEDIAALPLWHGKERTRVGEFFAISGAGDDVRMEGDLCHVKFVGAVVQSRMIRRCGEHTDRGATDIDSAEFVVEPFDRGVERFELSPETVDFVGEMAPLLSVIPAEDEEPRVDGSVPVVLLVPDAVGGFDVTLAGHRGHMRCLELLDRLAAQVVVPLF